MQIPTRFSKRKMKAIDKTKMTKNARVEIVDSLYTRMLQHADYPSSHQYTTAVRRLVETYPNLKDKTDTGFVSKN